MLDLERAPRRETAMVAAIPRRQCSRTPYDGRDLPAEILSRIATESRCERGHLLVPTARDKRETVLEAVVAGHRRQVTDPDFIAERHAWIRFGVAEAVARRWPVATASPRAVPVSLFPAALARPTPAPGAAAMPGRARPTRAVDPFLLRDRDRGLRP